MNIKYCTKCKEKKPWEAFSRNKLTFDGLSCYCRACQSAYNGTKVSRASVKDLLAEGLKRCSKCRKIKPINEYRKEKRVKSGLSAQCKYCMSSWGQRCEQKDFYKAPLASTPTG